MKYPLTWLNEWVDCKAISLDALSTKLTQAGFEIESTHHDILDVAVPPNRGDCLSLRGFSQEAAAVLRASTNKQPFPKIRPTIKDKLPLTLSTTACSHYVGRIIRGVNSQAVTPAWLQERLVQSGLKLIHPVVDIVNYVMLELGQPMHAFDLHYVQKGLCVRLSRSGETVELLDDSKQSLDDETIVIADQDKVLAIAGVMGGKESAVSAATCDILLESAYFAPTSIARTRQAYGLQSESALRFERGVSPLIQEAAMLRATALIIEITGGEPGPLFAKKAATFPPRLKSIRLTSEKVKQITGIDFKNKVIESIFKALNFKFKSTREGWIVVPPLDRPDITLPEDLIEEIVRLHGCEHIPTQAMQGLLSITKAPVLHWDEVKHLLCHEGYQEIISYSFVEKTLQTLLNPHVPFLPLVNPLSEEMSAMRTNLWPGLMKAFLYNTNRQQENICLFEIGTCFLQDNERVAEISLLSGLISGRVFGEQWGFPKRIIDFYDVKGDIEAILRTYHLIDQCVFKAAIHPALHPGKTAFIYHQEQLLGMVGALHPEVALALKLKEPVFLFELNLKILSRSAPMHCTVISPFPEIRRDIAILVKETIPFQAIQDTIKGIAGNVLKNLFIFDVYQGKSMAVGMKSIALAIILQHDERTLIEAEVTVMMEKILTALERTFGATLRNG